MAKYKIVWGGNRISQPDIERKMIEDANCQNEYDLVICSGSMGGESFFRNAADADAVCAYIAYTADILDKLPKCKVVAVPALGSDLIYSAPATERGICMTNLPPYCVEEVATHTVALILDCVRRISRLDRRLKNGVWDWKERGRQYRLLGRTYGLVSFGNIAQRAAEMLKGFGVKIMAYDPFLPDSAFEKMGVVRAETIEELFEKCDIISIHTPFTPDTHHIIGKKQFDLIKKEVILVITGRGGVVDENALKNAIEGGKIPAAGLDVIEDELTFKSVLTQMPEVVMTPHVAYYSEESEQDVRIYNMLNILDVLEYNRLPRNLINKDVDKCVRFLKGI